MFANKLRINLYNPDYALTMCELYLNENSTFEIQFNINVNSILVKTLASEKNIISDLKKWFEYIKKLGLNEDKQKIYEDILNDIDNNIKEYLQCKTYIIEGSLNNILVFLNNNKGVLSETVYINEPVAINEKTYKKIYRELITSNKDENNTYFNNLYIYTETCGMLRWVDYKNIIVYINQIDFYSKNMSSTLEKSFFIYDMWRSLLGENYRLLNMILTQNDIPSEIIYVGDNHPFIVSHIEDTEYGINNLFFTDPTYYVRKKSWETAFLENYSTAFRTVENIELINKRHGIYDKVLIDDNKIKRIKGKKAINIECPVGINEFIKVLINIKRIENEMDNNIPCTISSIAKTVANRYKITYSTSEKMVYDYSESIKSN